MKVYGLLGHEHGGGHVDARRQQWISLGSSRIRICPISLCCASWDRGPGDLLEYSLIQQSVTKHLLYAMYGVRLMGDSSDQVSQSLVLDVTVRGGKVSCKGGISGGKCLG